MSYHTAEGDRRIENTLQMGEVVAVDTTAGTARVRLGDLTTHQIPWMTQKAAGDHAWWPLQEGEWVMVGAPSGDMAQAVILGAVPTGKNPPHGGAGIWRLSFEDGSFIEFDNGEVNINATGDINFTAAGRFNVTAATIHLNEGG